MARRRRYLRPPHTILAHGSGQVSSQRCTSSSRSVSHANPDRCCSLTTQPGPVPTSSNGHVEPINSTKRPAQKRSGATMSTRALSAARLARPNPRDPSEARRRTSITPFDPTKCSSTTLIPRKQRSPAAGQVVTASHLAAPTYVAEEGNLVEPVCSGPMEHTPAPQRLRRARTTIAPVVLEWSELGIVARGRARSCVVSRRSFADRLGLRVRRPLRPGTGRGSRRDRAPTLRRWRRALLCKRGEQEEVALDDRLGDIDQLSAVGLGVVSEHLE